MPIKLEKDAGVAIVRMDTGDTGLMTARLAHELLATLTELDAAPEVRAVILTGDKDGIFIRHYDVKGIVKAAAAIRDGKIGEEAFLEAPFLMACDLCENSKKPFIAAMNGITMGGGLELALACDIRVARADIRQIGFPEIRIGIFPGSGGTQRLTRGIGKSAATNFILQGAVVDAKEAHRLHIVNELNDDPLSRAREIARLLASRSPEAVAVTKALLWFALDGTMAEGLNAERVAMARLSKATDAQERMQAFLDSGKTLDEWP